MQLAQRVGAAPLEAPRHPEVSTRKEDASRVGANLGASRGRRGGVGAGARTRAREERAWVSRRRALGTGGSGRGATRLVYAELVWRQFSKGFSSFVHIWQPVEPNISLLR